jgi:hypothetical protein
VWQILIEPLKICNKTTNANQVNDGNDVSNMLGGAFQATGVGGLESRYREHFDTDVGENRERNGNTISTKYISACGKDECRSYGY